MRKKKNPIFKRGMLWMICAIVSVCSIGAVSFYSGVAPTAQTPSTDDSSGYDVESIETLSVEERKQLIRARIDETVDGWASGTISFEEASAILTDIQQTSNPDLSDYAAEQLAFITVEYEGNAAFDLAQKFLGVKNYIQVFTYLNKINPSYSGIDAVRELYQVCEERVLETVENPTSIAEFEAFIQLLKDCENLYESEALTSRRDELADELVIFIDVTETIDAATIQYDAQNIEESFVLLALGLEKYPENEMLATTLVNYRDHYLITVTKEAVELCKKEEYKKAIAVVETAIGEYDCLEFQTLLEAIKEESSFLYRLKNDIIGAITSVTTGWSEEEFDVKQAANNAGAYVVKSGKKLVLGDYSNENVTLLSFTGNVASSLLGADLLFDLRDLSYDITHWGEDEYFAVWLAADVVALLPVVGVVKYLSHFKTAANGVDAATELVDSVADVSKNAENAAELADAISDVTKIGDDIVDAIDDAKDAMKVGETAKDVAADVAKGYTLIPTINKKYAGKIHEESGVLYGLSKCEYLDGRKIMGVFPVFESKAEVQLPEELYKASSYKQQKYCIDELKDDVSSFWSKYKKSFTEEELEDIANGVIPEGYVWHHNEQEGLMQLVKSDAHEAAKHTGGMALWGRGY